LTVARISVNDMRREWLVIFRVCRRLGAMMTFWHVAGSGLSALQEWENAAKVKGREKKC